MKDKHWLLLFFFVLAAHITAMRLQHEGLQMVFKPMIVMVLVGYFDSRVQISGSTLAKWVIAALFFSVIGDSLLLFQERKSIFFLLGLSSFLMAHICYIGFFGKIWKKETLRIRWLIPLAAVVYYAALIYVLFPHLLDMKVPVMVYGIVISTMLVLAAHMQFISNQQAGNWLMAGAILFVISDSVLALNKFYKPFNGADIVIMITYGLAQLLIVKGAADYLTKKQPE